jgi:adenylosuccinate lyase
MAFKNNPPAAERAEAAFKVPPAQTADAPKAVRDYWQRQQTALDQMEKLREQRLARERSKQG